MKKKKFYKEDIIDAIVDRFGSVENFAEHLGTTRQNIYGKIDRQSRKFIKELKDNGIILNEGIQIGEMGANDNKGTISIETTSLKSEIEKLKAENEMLKEIIKNKDVIIGLLKKQN